MDPALGRATGRNREREKERTAGARASEGERKPNPKPDAELMFRQSQNQEGRESLVTNFDPTPYLPHWARAEPRPMRQAIYTIEQIMLHAPGVGLQIAALHRPGTRDERLEALGTVDPLGNTTADNLREILRQARGSNVNKRSPSNILFRPDPTQAHPWLFCDDLSTERLLALASQISCIAIQTSQGNGQVRLLADRPMSLDERGAAQRVLSQRLGGDPGSRSGEKWGRLPGFTNQKPGKQGQWTNILADTTGIRPAAPADRLLSLAPGGAISPSPAAAASSRPPAGSPGFSPASLCSAGGSTKKADYARDALQRVAPAANEGVGGYRQDMAAACQALRAGIPRSEIVQAIATRALARGKRRTEADALKYSQATLRAAETSCGLLAA
jgi:hypothetical protein